MEVTDDDIKRTRDHAGRRFATCDNLSLQTPYPEEAGNAATLIAEVGTLRARVAEATAERDTALARAEQAERALAEYKQLALTKTVAHPLVVAVESETAEQIAAWLESVRDYTSVWANCPVGWRRDVAEAVRRGAWRTTKGPSR